MAIRDVLALFSGAYSAGALTGQTATGTDTSVVSTNSYDTRGGGSQTVDLGKGEPLEVSVNVLTSASGGTSVEVQVVSADDTALTTNVTPLVSSGAIPVASVVAGKQINLTIPPVDPRTLRRYIGLRYVFVGAVAAGAYSAGFAHEDGDIPQPLWNSGFTVG